MARFHFSHVWMVRDLAELEMKTLGSTEYALPCVRGGGSVRVQSGFNCGLGANKALWFIVRNVDAGLEAWGAVAK